MGPLVVSLGSSAGTTRIRTLCVEDGSRRPPLLGESGVWVIGRLRPWSSAVVSCIYGPPHHPPFNRPPVLVLATWFAQ
jgi:hypothetical protein